MKKGKKRASARRREARKMAAALRAIRRDRRALRALRRFLAPLIRSPRSLTPAARRGMAGLRPVVKDTAIRLLLVAAATTGNGGTNRVIRCYKNCMRGVVIPEFIPGFEDEDGVGTDFDPENPPGSTGEEEAALECWLNCLLEPITL